MKVRTGPGPNDWRDEGPATPHRVQTVYGSRPANVGAAMIPILTYGGNSLENKHRTRPVVPLRIKP